MRYVLPIFPFVIISTGKLAYFFTWKRWKSGVVVASLALWMVISSLMVYPHSLSYFNEAAGGPDKGHDHLLDSNIDWGQDLLYLKRWLDEHPEVRPLQLAYFNFTDPHIAGIDFSLPPLGPAGHRPEDDEAEEQLGPRPGYFAVSVNFVRGSSFFVPDGEGRLQVVPLHGYEYFRHFQPIAKAGYSIFIYHITLEQANEVRMQLGMTQLANEK